MTEPTTATNRLPRCRRIITIKGQGRSTAAKVGPPAHERCSAEVADANHESKLCPAHLAAALRDLIATGAIHLAGACDTERRQAEQVAELLAHTPAGGVR